MKITIFSFRTEDGEVGFPIVIMGHGHSEDRLVELACQWLNRNEDEEAHTTPEEFREEYEFESFEDELINPYTGGL